MNIKTFLLLAIAFTQLVMGCGYLCNSCDITTNTCLRCTQNAIQRTFMDCECEYGYSEIGGKCEWDGGDEDMLIFIGIVTVFLFIILTVVFVRIARRRQRQRAMRYNRMNEDAMAYPVAAPQYSPYAPTNADAVNSTAIPVGVPMNPYRPQVVQNTLKCSICYADNPDCQTSCGHPYHKVCLDRWTHRTCAICHQNVPELAYKWFTATFYIWYVQSVETVLSALIKICKNK